MSDQRQNTQRREAVDMILQERVYQTRRWAEEGDSQRSTVEWTGILSVYLGKLAQESELYQERENKERVRKRLTQIAAICVAALENL